VHGTKKDAQRVAAELIEADPLGKVSLVRLTVADVDR
jgi:hypothetical protein